MILCYTVFVTRDERIAHWQEGAHDALDAAMVLLREGKNALALFHCHLAAEKALKASYIADNDAVPPHTHKLLNLALELKEQWSDEDQKLLNDLTVFAIAARYDDDLTEDQTAPENVQWWIDQVQTILSRLEDD
mgnify:CR=1 FL=1